MINSIISYTPEAELYGRIEISRDSARGKHRRSPDRAKR
jgi:hypothetical protein